MSSNSESEVVSKEVLEKAIGRKIESFTCKAGSEVGDNYMSVLYALTVNVEASEDKKKETLHLLSKCIPANPARQSFLQKSNIFYNELMIYKEWIPALIKFQRDMGLEKIVEPAFPPFVAGESVNFKDDNNNQPKDKVYKPFEIYIMMDDLRENGNFKMADRLNGFDKDHVYLAVTALAEIHALSWVYKQKHNINAITELFPTMQLEMNPEDKQMFINVMEGSIQSTLEAIKITHGKDSPLYKGTENFISFTEPIMDIAFGVTDAKESALYNYMRVKPEEIIDETRWSIVCHGDCWVNNMLFRYDSETGKPEKVILVDLQMCRDACPTLDLSYLIYTSTNGEFRKNYLDSTLELYAEKFNEVCSLLQCDTLPGFNVPELKRRFHRAKLSGYSMAQICLPIMLKDKGQQVDVETIQGGMEDIFMQIGTGTSQNARYNKRMLEVVEDMYNDGII